MRPSTLNIVTRLGIRQGIDSLTINKTEMALLRHVKLHAKWKDCKCLWLDN